MTPKWRALVVRGELSADLLKEIDGASGAYAVREKSGHVVVYVGESHTGALRKTMLRHFHAASSFKKDRRPAHGAATFATDHPERYEVAIWVTSRGKRSKSSADEKAMAAQAKWIETLRPEKNIDPGVTEPFEQADEEDAWGGLLNPGRRVRVPAGVVGFEPRGVLAGRYDFGRMKEGRPTLTHAVWLDAEGDEVGEKSVCGRIDIDGLVDHFGSEGEIDCPACKKKIEGFRSLVSNPAVMTALGKLTSISFSNRVGRARPRVLELHWPIRSAPTLAYDGAKRLHVLYTDRVVRPSTDAETKEYRRAHWGESGEGKTREAREAVGPFHVLGQGVGIVYTTRKGDDATIVDYEHPWGSGRRGRFEPPKVIEHRCKDKRCPLEGACALSGGSYTVTEHGIVG